MSTKLRAEDVFKLGHNSMQIQNICNSWIFYIATSTNIIEAPLAYHRWVSLFSTSQIEPTLNLFWI